MHLSGESYMAFLHSFPNTMRGFFLTVLILGGLGAAGYFLWEPYIQPMLEGDKPSLSDDSAIGTGEEAKKPASTTTKAPATKPKTSGSTATTSSKSKAPAAKPKSEIDLLLEKRYPTPAITGHVHAHFGFLDGEDLSCRRVASGARERTLAVTIQLF